MLRFDSHCMHDIDEITKATGSLDQSNISQPKYVYLTTFQYKNVITKGGPNKQQQAAVALQKNSSFL